MPENQERFVPIDDDGWPILDDVILTPSGWRPRSRFDRPAADTGVADPAPGNVDLILPRPVLPPSELPTVTRPAGSSAGRPVHRPPTTLPSPAVPFPSVRDEQSHPTAHALPFGPPSLPPVELPLITRQLRVTPASIPPPPPLRPARLAPAETVRFNDVAPTPDSDWYRDLASDEAAITPDAEPELPDGFVFPKRRRRRRVRPFALFVLAGLVAIAGLAWQRSRQVGISVGSLRPGYCLVLPPAEASSEMALDRFDRIRCDLAHNAEVFATKVFDTSAPFAGGEGLAKVAGATCESSVPPVIRSHPEAANWSIQYFAPTTAETYRQGKRATLLCVVRFSADRTLPLIG